MKAENPINLRRLTLAILLPLAAFVLQAMFWTAIKPFAWFLFFPAVFFSSWIGGLAGGVIATLISTALAWWAFIPPERSFVLDNPFYPASIAMFMGMGFLFGYTQEQIKKANRKTAEALAAAHTANEQLQSANGKITQLYNLLSNAFKFTPADGIVTLTLNMADERAVIRVQDNGPGVPAAMREAVFERFRQVEGGAGRRFGGTGLGLAIVKDFVKLHNGSAAVEEAPGGGALFTVTLPLAAPAGAEIQPAPGALDEEINRQALDELSIQESATMRPPPALTANAPLVLVVEDNPDMNIFVAEALGRHYRVVTAFDGEEGLRKAFEIRPDLIVSDVMMPRMTSDQMVEALRRHRKMDDVPIVLLTAKADDHLRVKLFKEGIQDYIYKPFSVEELLARTGGLISERKRFESIQKANRMKSEFLANMSHELRTPLNGIIGFSEFLADEKPEPLNAKQKEYLGDILNSGKHLLQLINDILDLAKVEAGKMELSLEEFSLKEAVSEVSSVISPTVKKKGLEFNMQMEPGIEIIRSDRQKLK